jgi:hypothetical protein
MEGINNRLKLIKRQAYGFINSQNMRDRFYCFRFIAISIQENTQIS